MGIAAAVPPGGGQLAHRPEKSAQAQQGEAGLLRGVALGGQGEKSLPAPDGLYLDTTTQGSPALVAGADYRAALEELAHRPFRMAPYYDPGVWGATG